MKQKTKDRPPKYKLTKERLGNQIKSVVGNPFNLITLLSFLLLIVLVGGRKPRSSPRGFYQRAVPCLEPSHYPSWDLGFGPELGLLATKKEAVQARPPLSEQSPGQ